MSEPAVSKTAPPPAITAESTSAVDSGRLRPDSPAETNRDSRAAFPRQAKGSRSERFVALSAAGTELRRWVVVVLSGYAELLALRDWSSGLIVCLATFSNPRIGTCGLLAVAGAYLAAFLLGTREALAKHSYYVVNALLIGLALGSVLAMSWTAILLIVGCGAIGLVMTTAVAQVFRVQLHLPALSLPSVLCIVLAEAAILRYSNLVHSADPVVEAADLTLALPLPPSIAAFCRTLGAILYSPQIVVGLSFALLLLARSRVLFSLALGGYCLGTFVRAQLFGSYGQAYDDLYNYNFILIGMLVGGVLLVPSWTSYSLAALAVLAAVVLLDALTVFMAQFGLPPYNIPFNLVTLVFLYAAQSAASGLVPTSQGATPEETLEMDLATRGRFPVHNRRLRLPFFGEWTVWQAFSDRWTHQGKWQHAYDFVITDAEGHTFQGNGTALEDYYCYRKPVASPIVGKVVKVVNNLADCCIGRVDRTHNWGNLVVIHDSRGFYVELSHFAAHSIRVREGDWVAVGTLLGLCGNSGYSPQPHLHVQVQAEAAIGSPTQEFCWSAYRHENRFVPYGLPKPGEVIEPAATDEGLERVTDFVLGEQFSYAVEQRGRSATRLDLVVKMALDGTFYFEADGGARLYFGKHDGCLFFYRVEGEHPLLRRIYSALPVLPLVSRRELRWVDEIPATTVMGSWQRLFAQHLAPLFPWLVLARVAGAFESDLTIVTEAHWGPDTENRRCRITFDQQKGLATLASPDYIFRRIDQ